MGKFKKYQVVFIYFFVFFVPFVASSVLILKISKNF